MTPRRVFIAGSIQGANKSLQVDDQGYRQAIALLVREHFPAAECFDPSLETLRRLSNPQVAEVVRAVVADVPRILEIESLPPEIAGLRNIFHEMAQEVANCDLCVAFLVGRSLSMGTAMEMYAAHSSGVPIVSVTSLIDNLAVVSVSSWIVADLAALADFFAAYAREQVAP